MGKYIAHIRADGTKQTCTEHCINTATIASSLLNSVGLSKTGYLAGLLHDMGKFNDQFLNYIQTVSSGVEYRGPKVIHTFTGVSYILSRYHVSEEVDSFDKLTSELIALSIGSHHGLFDIYHEADDYNAFIHRMEKQPNYDKEAIDNFFSECVKETEIESLFRTSKEEIKKLYTEIVIYLKRTENDQQRILKEVFFFLYLLFRLVLSAVVEGDRRDTSAFIQDEDFSISRLCEWSKEIEHFNSYISFFVNDTPIQKARMKFSQACCDFAKETGAIYRLNLPTGGGKTLSGLRYALAHAKNYKKNRVFYVAPLLSILEQNAKIIKKAISNDGEVLLHYSNVVEEERESDELDKRELLQESWSSKIVITTLVQMLQTLFSGRMSSIRRFNSLANSVIIFDEIQSLPMKMYSMFNLAINFLSKCCNTTVILCSATLPSFESAKYRMDISPNSIITKELICETKPIFKRTEIKKWDKNLRLEEVSDVVLAQMNKSNNVLVVCNTKREASYLFNELKQKTSINLFHLSAGMCPKHRRKMLSNLYEALKKDATLICISTQVIEAGIDISFSCVFRFAAGIDSVVQSAGRCNRNGMELTLGNVYVLKIVDETLTGLREIQQKKEAFLNLLAQFDDNPAKFDNDLASLRAVDYYYKLLFSCLNIDTQDYPNPIEGSGRTLLSYLSDSEYLTRDSIKRKGQKNYTFFQSFETASNLFTVFDNLQKTVIVPYDEDSRDLIATLQTDTVLHDFSLQKNLLKRAEDYSVSIFNSTFDALNEKGAILKIEALGIFCLRDEFYDAFTGVSTKEVSKCNILMM